MGRAYHLRALVHEKLGETERALRDFDRAIEIDPEYGAAYYSRAMMREKLGQADAAFEDIRMYTHLTEKNLSEFASENNMWQSRHLALEASGIADVMSR
ncbi:hypothetical protein DENIS_0824 [Desulfonema ishimotonii]|uniref:Uncharacterized protein n=1 Tax=Desulfonema ishimotonii TaxID=45657 RepID=A0A401FSF3_9BACT|nr:tetratricopeptide repeat protein [Desulfonema ishimotonii]GBC59883.1 hypothetical protein DENIS_0824 [Desulfonema ishimotonii]